MNKYREVYENLSKNERDVVNNIFDEVSEYCKENKIKIAYDDRAENFVGAITEYLITSGVIKA
jgi:hypothetical protein